MPLSETKLTEIRDAAADALVEILSTGKDVVVNGRRYSHDDIDKIQGIIDWAEAELASVARGGGLRARRAVPIG